MDILKGIIENIGIWQIASVALAGLLSIVGFKLSKLKGVIKVLNDALEDNEITADEFQKIFKKLKALFTK